MTAADCCSKQRKGFRYKERDQWLRSSEMQKNTRSSVSAGVKDILILGDRIAAVGEHLRADFGGSLEVQEINGEDMAAVPGFIDSHEHILEEAERAASTRGRLRLLWGIWSEMGSQR